MFTNAVQAKIASMVLIGAGSFIVGVTPACFVSHAEHLQRKLLLSCTLCFGAGVLLATACLHMLPEVRENLPDHAELVFTCGFLVLYLVEECVHYFCPSSDHEANSGPGNSRQRNTHERGANSRHRCHSVGFNVTTQDEKVCISENDSRLPFVYRQTLSANNLANNDNNAWTVSSYGTAGCMRNSMSQEEATFLCHTNQGEQCADFKTGLTSLALALTVHAVLEGLAIGLQTQIAEVLLLTGAVASHKFVVGFCLGLELTGISRSVAKLIFTILLFAGGSVLGIGIGMLMFQVDTDWLKVGLPILQGLAGGTLLYVTVSEVLPRERAKWHKSPRKYAGILQFISMVTGFVLIFLLNRYVGA